MAFHRAAKFSMSEGMHGNSRMDKYTLSTDSGKSTSCSASLQIATGKCHPFGKRCK